MNTLQAYFKAPSNIALIKYWGKREIQIPENTSISFTLKNCVSKTKIICKNRNADKNISVFFEGKNNEKFVPKIEKMFQLIKPLLPWINDYEFEVHTENSFPHSSGIASSASSMCAIAACLADLNNQMLKKNELNLNLISEMARLGSGSACRSVFPNIAIWGKHSKIPFSNDNYAIDANNFLHENFKNYCDSILIVSNKEKSVSSTAGHGLMKNNPFSKVRFQSANENCILLLNALKNGDYNSFIEITEHEALTLHALMMTSTPSFMLFEAESIAIIKKILEYRNETKTPLCFTLDAGPNVHLLYPKNYKEKVHEFIKNELFQFCYNNEVIHDEMGNGVEAIQQ